MSNETKIAELLQRWSEAQPEVCRRLRGKRAVYVIGDYEFELDGDELMVSLGSIACTGRPALAWLRDAVEAAIEAAHLHYDGENFYLPSGYKRRIDIGNARWTVRGTSSAEALLKVWVYYLDGKVAA